MKILLICNYPPDAQQSMLRFADVLRRGLAGRGWDVVPVAPKARWGGLTGRGPGPRSARWLGYMDKYLLFPLELRRKARVESARGPLLAHVIDHGNSIYLPARADIPWVVTCHDMLAVRGALGEATDCPATILGRRLQRGILAGLRRAGGVACDSASTLGDLDRLAPREPGHLRRVIPLGQNHPYGRVDPAAARARLSSLSGVPWEQPFLLHVGSNLARKNKAAVIDVLGRLRGRWDGNAVFCGAPMTPELSARSRDAQLEAVYSLAHALVFPSNCEGFGWPVIEAQACGCPVIASDRTSLPEVGGEGAVYFAPDDTAGMAGAVLGLGLPEARAAAVARGRTNAARFSKDRMIDDYIGFYAEVAACQSRGVPLHRA
jgi:glycosyltransferase involved in cell wall biosynthesis